jgi:hypothetical protein
VVEAPTRDGALIVAINDVRGRSQFVIDQASGRKSSIQGEEKRTVLPMR